MGTEIVDNVFHMFCQMLEITNNSFSCMEANQKRLVTYAVKQK